MSRIIFHLSETKSILYQERYDSLLSVLEAHKVQIEYQCRKGYCGSCRCRLFSGQVDWLIDPVAFVKDGEILLCCCRAKSDVEIGT